jgi:hypothetical protein
MEIFLPHYTDNPDLAKRQSNLITSVIPYQIRSLPTKVHFHLHFHLFHQHPGRQQANKPASHGIYISLSFHIQQEQHPAGVAV